MKQQQKHCQPAQQHEQCGQEAKELQLTGGLENMVEQTGAVCEKCKHSKLLPERVGRGAGKLRTPRESSGRPLGLAEKRKAQRDHRRTHEQGEHGVGNDDLPDDPNAGGNGSAGFGEQAGDRDITSFGNSSSTKSLPFGWLRELDSNQRFQGENLAN